MKPTFYHAGAAAIPRTTTHALLHTAELAMLRRRPGTLERLAIEAWCDAMHERLTVTGGAHVCAWNAMGRIQQIWVLEPQAVLTDEHPLRTSRGPATRRLRHEVGA